MEYIPGSIVLIHGDGFFDKLIQFGQHLRFSKEESFYNHAALIINTNGDLIEALGYGVKQTNIAKYSDQKYQMKIIDIGASIEDRSEVVAFAATRLHDGYGWTTILSSALCLLFGLKFAFGFSSQDICSGLCARALERTTAIFPREPRNMTPADLASFYRL